MHRLQHQQLMAAMHNERLQDVNFLVGPQKQRFKINRLPLSLISSVFEELLQNKQQNTFILEDIDSNGFELVIKFEKCIRNIKHL